MVTILKIKVRTKLAEVLPSSKDGAQVSSRIVKDFGNSMQVEVIKVGWGKLKIYSLPP